MIGEIPVSELLKHQFDFTAMVAQLIAHSWGKGVQLTFGEVYRPPETCELYAKQGRGIANSLHQLRLAVDFNAFHDGKYQAGPWPYDLLHDYWDTLGGARRIPEDLGHFSKEYRGVI